MSDNPISDLSGAGESDLGEAVKRIIESGEAAKVLDALRSSGAISSAAGAPAPAEYAGSAAAPSPASQTDMKDMMAGLGNISPLLMEKLPAIMSVMNSGGAMNKVKAPGKSEESRKRTSQRDALLRALKPYLRDTRREMVNTILNLGDMTKVFESFSNLAQGKGEKS